MNTYEAKVLADSISPDHVRLTTLQVTFPRFILAELNTHRMLSRNSASSRAIPTEKQIERAREHTFIPETFNKRVKGMGVGEEFSEEDARYARRCWEEAAEAAATYAEALNDLGLDKSRANRLLEPFIWHTAIVSATEWDNFFALRDHPAAQPEFQILARMMRDAMRDSDPTYVGKDSWHLPLVDIEEVRGPGKAWESRTPTDWREAFKFWKMVSAGRCARVSYDTHENFEDISASVKRARILMGNGHFSPFEHVARPMAAGDKMVQDQTGAIPELTFSGNFRGWVQMRKEIPNEANFGAAVTA